MTDAEIRAARARCEAARWEDWRFGSAADSMDLPPGAQLVLIPDKGAEAFLLHAHEDLRAALAEVCRLRGELAGVLAGRDGAQHGALYVEMTRSEANLVRRACLRQAAEMGPKGAAPRDHAGRLQWWAEVERAETLGRMAKRIDVLLPGCGDLAPPDCRPAAAPGGKP